MHTIQTSSEHPSAKGHANQADQSLPKADDALA